MGFYLRKSFKMGPMRLNLSKSGLGVSTGVRGARVGISSTGRAYVHGGRGGLYVRQYLGSGGRGPAGSTRHRSAEVLFEDTGATYQKPSPPETRPSLRAALVRRAAPLALFLMLPLSGAIVAIYVIASSTLGLPEKVIGIGIGLALVAAGSVPVQRAYRKNRAGTRLGVLLADSFRGRAPIASQELEAIGDALADTWITDLDRAYQCQKAYTDLIIAVVADGKVSAEELALLNQIEPVLNQDSAFYRLARVEGFREVYLAAVADSELTEVEDATLTHVREALAIPASALKNETEVLDRLREIREIRAGALPTATPSKPLQKSEVCHYEAAGRILKEKNLQSFQRDGQRYKVRGLVVDKEGQLYVTNKRILLVHAGTTSIRLDRIMDLEVDYDRNLMLVTKDGAQKPVLLTTPDCVKAGAIVAAAASL